MEPPQNIRTKLMEQSLQLMDDILHMGTIERLCWAGRTAAMYGNLQDVMVRELNRPECQKQINSNPFLFGKYQELLERLDHDSWYDMAKEAAELVMTMYAQRIALHTALNEDPEKETSVDRVSKMYNEKLKAMQRGL